MSEWLLAVERWAIAANAYLAWVGERMAALQDGTPLPSRDVPNPGRSPRQQDYV